MDTSAIPALPKVAYRAEPVKAFQLKEGKTHAGPLVTVEGHTQRGEILQGGAILDLTAEQAAAFADKFTAVDDKPFAIKTAAVTPSAPTTAVK